jgi:hypothetical protein
MRMLYRLDWHAVSQSAGPMPMAVTSLDNLSDFERLFGALRCETLDLLPVDRAQLGFNPTQDGANMSSWGGSVVSIDGEWHLWCSLLANHCGISSYLVNSGVVHAVSKSGSPLGPFVLSDAVLPAFAHEPVMALAPTGELVLASVTGQLGPAHRSCQCATGATPRSCDTCNNSCFPQRKTLTVSASGSPGGPWASRPMFPHAADNAGENPSVWIARNGSAYGYARGHGTAAFASDWSNVSTWLKDPFPGSDVSSRPDAEDPFIYQVSSEPLAGKSEQRGEDPFDVPVKGVARDARVLCCNVGFALGTTHHAPSPTCQPGLAQRATRDAALASHTTQDDDDHFHVISHNLEGPHMCGSMPQGQADCLVGVHLFSRDARMWMYGGLAYTATVVVLGEGEPMRLNRRERPHLAFAEGTRRPVALVNAAEAGGATGDRTFTLVQGIRQ